MKLEQFASLAIALCCLFAVGTAATTLDSAVSTDPDQVITFDHEALPVGAGAVGDLRKQVNKADENAQSNDKSEVQPDTADSGDPQRQSSKQSDQGQTSDSSSDSSSDTQSQSAGGGDSGQQGGGNGSSPAAQEPSLIERLLALLEALLALLLSILPYALLAAVAVGAVAFRDRIFDRLRSDAPAESQRAAAGASPEPLGEPDPQNDVARAWVELCSAFGLANRPELTPSEVQAEAISRGADREAVDELRRLFEDVRYGNAPVDDDRRRRARQQLRQLGLDGGRR